MFYPGPDRYGGCERRPPPPPMKEYSDPYSYGYPQQQQPGPPPPPPRDYYGMPPADPYRMRMMVPVDQGEELLDRLEQTGRVPSKDKFRRMACMTFVSTGVCPYNDRCVFMHDFRIKAENARVRTTRQTKANNLIKDTFYWPDMTRRDICRYLDAQGLPDANQRYVIPESFASSMSSFHNRGLYSIWNHFVEFCVHNSRLQEERRAIECDNFFKVSNYLGNRHIFGTYRLKIFVHLSMVVENTGARGMLDTSFGSGVTSKEGALSPSVGGSPYSFGTVTTPGGRQMMEGSSLFTPSSNTPQQQSGGKQQNVRAPQPQSPQQRSNDFALVGFPSAPSQDVRLAPSRVGNMADGDFLADTLLSAHMRRSGSGLGSPSPVMNFEAQRGEPQRRGGESYQQGPDAAAASASPRSLGSSSSYSLLLDTSPALYGNSMLMRSPARLPDQESPAGALPRLSQHPKSPHPGNAPPAPLIFPDSRHLAPSRGPHHWSEDDLSFQMVQAPRRLFSVSEDDEEGATKELSEEDELMAANTKANYLLSRSSEHLQQAGMSVTAAMLGALASPKAVPAKSVVWADAQRAKLEHWEGESATSVASAEDEQDSTSSLSADSYHPAERRLHHRSSSNWEALDLTQQRAQEQEAATSSAAWDRLPELQRASTSALFGDSIEDAAFELEQALDAGDAPEEVAGALGDQQNDEEWLAQQIQRTVAAAVVVAPTPSVAPTATITSVLPRPSQPAKELLDLAFIESGSDLRLLAGGAMPSPVLDPGGAGSLGGRFWDGSANLDDNDGGGALLSPVLFSTSIVSDAALWHPEVTEGNDSAAPDLAALLGLQRASGGPPSPIEKSAGTAGVSKRGLIVSSPLTP